MPIACIFSSIYFESCSKILHEHFPNSKIILFADNDRHLKDKNIGVTKAQSALKVLKENGLIAIPDFGSIEPSKSASDWNDLVRIMGPEEAKQQLRLLGIIDF